MKEKQPVHHPGEEDAVPSEQGQEYLLGRSILKRLKQTVNEEWDSWLVEEHEDTFKTLYLTERQVCIPEHLLSGDIMEDIMSLFYYPLSAVREALKERTGTKQFIWVFVQPSYTDTCFAVMASGEKVLLTVSDKAWNFFWEDEETMVKELEGWYETADPKDRRATRVVLADEGGVIVGPARQVAHKYLGAFERTLTPEELAQLVHLLENL